ncbi:MAG: nucleotidyl transferase AbiEii/AbiGii toxin family protein [Bacteroidota bacterium]|nr:nucleotidyl transferase AbiEii/AbiGii toxin family protein [Bacteroidota bacterium]
MLQYRAVYPKTLELLKILMKYKSLQDFFLVGGTSLALQLGHRISVDLDLFLNKDFETVNILQELNTNLEFKIILQKEQNSLTINARKQNINDEFVKIDFIKYPYPLINKVIKSEGLRLLSIEDIIAMKLSAISNRGAKKDFYDIYELLKTFTISEMFKLFSIKFPQIAHFHVLKSLTYFEDAESQFSPLTLNNTKWEQVKTTIEKKVNEYL